MLPASARKGWVGYVHEDTLYDKNFVSRQRLAHAVWDLGPGAAWDTRRLAFQRQKRNLAAPAGPVVVPLPHQRIFYPRRGRVDQAAEFGLGFHHSFFHLPGYLAIAEVTFHSAAEFRDVFGLGEVHLK